MKHTKFIVVTAGVLSAFTVGHLTAQPARLAAPPPAPVVDPAYQAFQADLGAAVKQNHHSKVIRLLNEAAGDAKLTDAVIQRTWDMDFNAEPAGDRREVLQATFAMKQQQRQIELLEQLLVEMKKSHASKPK